MALRLLAIQPSTYGLAAINRYRRVAEVRIENTLAMNSQGYAN